MAEPHDNAMLAQLTELESRIAFQDDTIEILNQLVTRQNDQLHALARKVQQLSERLEQMQEPGEQGNTDPANEIPPHY